MVNNMRTANPSLSARRLRRLTPIEEESTTWLVLPWACKNDAARSLHGRLHNNSPPAQFLGGQSAFWPVRLLGVSAPGYLLRYSVRAAFDRGPWYHGRCGSLSSSWAFSSMVDEFYAV